MKSTIAITTALVACSSMMLAAIADAADAPPRRASAPGMTYASLKALPGFGGAWVPDTPMFNGAVVRAGGPQPMRPEIRPEVVARYAAGMERYLSGAPVDRGYCLPATFAGQMPMDAGGSLEILLNPGRVTIAVESGLVRRIYLRDTPPPGALQESRGGVSYAHWEGRTLVVHTTGISRNAEFLHGIPVGRGATVLERISLRGSGALEIKATTTAPDVLLAPLTTVNVYKRAHGRLFTDFDTCVKTDRSFDQTGAVERFDVAPPPDLPPPPSQ
jgi:hypothetical protein